MLCKSWFTWLFTLMWGIDKHHYNLMWFLCNNWHFSDKFMLYLIYPSILLLVETFRISLMQSAPAKMVVSSLHLLQKYAWICVCLWATSVMRREQENFKQCEEIIIIQRQSCLSFEANWRLLHLLPFILQTFQSNKPWK